MAGISSSVQFRGADMVLEAFDQRNIEAWALWQGKQFIGKGIGREPLEWWLVNLQKMHSTAVYTLKVFEDIKDEKCIKEKTECDGSFNFRLFEPGDIGAINGYYREGAGFMPPAVQKALQEQDAKIDRIVALLEDQADDEEPEPVGALGVIGQLLQEPEKLEKLIRVGKALLGVGDPVPARVGSVNRLEGAAEEKTVGEDSVYRMASALDILEKHDPDFVAHLEKLAGIAEQKPDQFKNLIAMLDVF